MTLTTDQLIEILIEEATGREHTIHGPEADAFRQEVAKDLAHAKSKGWTIRVPSEWDVKGADNSGEGQEAPDVQKGGPGSGCQGPKCGRPKINMGRLINTKELRSYFGRNFRQDASSVERGWLLPNGRGVTLPSGNTHEELLQEVGASPSEAFKAGWVRKVTPESYNFDATNPSAQDIFRQDLELHIQDLKDKNSPTIYIDDEHNQYYFKLPINVVESALHSRDSMDALLNPRWLGKSDSKEYTTIFKGGPGSGCNPDVGECGRPRERGGSSSDGGAKGGLEAKARKFASADKFVRVQTIVYHGSATPLESFSNDKGGVFFTEEYADATGFAGSPDNVYEGYLNFKNPLVIDAKGAKWNELDTKYGTSTQEVVSNAQKDGHDGVVFKNIVDNVMDTADVGGATNIYYAYKPANSFLNEAQLRDLWNRENKKLGKGGPGSGCQGPNCGRPKSVSLTVNSKPFSIKSKYPKAFKFNETDPVSTKYANGETIDKFVVTQDNTFIPVLADQRHGHALSDLRTPTGYDASTRVVQDLSRKLAFIRIAHPDERVINAAIIDGDERAMNQILNYQKGVAEELYGNRKGMTIILASGGTPRGDQNNLPNDLDNGHQLPDKPQSYVNSKFIYKT